MDPFPIRHILTYPDTLRTAATAFSKPARGESPKTEGKYKKM